MKTQTITSGLRFVLTSTFAFGCTFFVQGQEDGTPSKEEELFTRVFQVRPDFLSLGSTRDNSTFDDPFAEDISVDPFADDANELPPGKSTSAMDILKAAGVKFPNGASAFFNKVSSQLIVRTTAANLDLVADFLERNAPGPTAKQIGVTVEFYQLAHADLNARLRRHLAAGKSDATEFRNSLDKVVREGNGNRIASAYVITRSGQRAGTDSVVEHIYPVEFDPPEVPQKLLGEITGHPDLKTEVSATSFRTQDTGLTVEVDPVLGADGSTIDLSIATEIIEYLGEKTYGKEESKMSQPIFNAISLSTATTIRAGNWSVLGQQAASTPLRGKAGAAGERVVGLVRANVLHTKLVPEHPGRVIDSPVTVSVLAEYIEVDDSEGANLLSELDTSASATALHEKLSEMVEAGSAKLIESATLTTRSGQRAKVSSGKRWIYPTEMDPPEIPQEIRGPIEQGVDFITPLSFTAFDTRNVGTTLEVDPVTGPGKVIIDINLAPELVAYFGDSKHGRGASEAIMPVFATMKTSTAITARSGEPVLVTVLNPLDRITRRPDPSKRVFLILTAACMEASEPGSKDE